MTLWKQSKSLRPCTCYLPVLFWLAPTATACLLGGCFLFTWLLASRSIYLASSFTEHRSAGSWIFRDHGGTVVSASSLARPASGRGLFVFSSPPISFPRKTSAVRWLYLTLSHGRNCLRLAGLPPAFSFCSSGGAAVRRMRCVLVSFVLSLSVCLSSSLSLSLRFSCYAASLSHSPLSLPSFASPWTHHVVWLVIKSVTWGVGSCDAEFCFLYG